MERPHLLTATEPATGVAAPAAPGEESPDLNNDEPPEAEEMIRIKGTRDAAGERVRFDRKNIILAYTEPAAKAGLEPLPAHGVGAASPAGDYFVYVDAGESTAFVKARD